MQQTMPFRSKFITVAPLQCMTEFHAEEFFSQTESSFFAKVDPDIRKFRQTIEKSPSLAIMVHDLPEDETLTEEQIVNFIKAKDIREGKINLAHVAELCQYKSKNEPDEEGEILLKTDRSNLLFMFDDHHHLYMMDIWKGSERWYLGVSNYAPCGKLLPGSRIFFIDNE